MRSLCLLLLLVTGCCHIPLPQRGDLPRPVTFGFDSIQCVPVRAVWCVPDEDYPAATCVRDVSDAINAVNSAVGRQVFRFAGVGETKDLKEIIERGDLPVVGIDDAHLPDQRVLALTVPKVGLENGIPCIEQVIIGVSPTVAGLRGPTPYNAVFILAHELVHALGAVHADPNGLFMSRMEPAYTRGLNVPFSRADIHTLRSVYNF